MKLKIKHVQQPQQAYRLEVPSDSTLSALRSAVVDTVPFAGEVAPSEVALSLNKKVRHIAIGLSPPCRTSGMHSCMQQYTTPRVRHARVHEPACIHQWHS